MNLEHEHQKALIHWWAIEAGIRGIDERVLTSIPNQGRGGGWKAARRGAWMKAEGLRAGMPDLILFVPSQGYHGLAIELKAPVKTARMSDSQKEMKAVLESQGYVHRTCFGWDAAREAIMGYLGAHRKKGGTT